MRQTHLGGLFGACLASLLLAGVAFGEEEKDPCKPAEDKGHTMERAGYPQHLSCLAAPSNTPAYTNYYVGGGAPCHGEGPNAEDGTWGWDYEGCWFKRNVALMWFHGRRYQGGTGAYKADGPHLPEK